MRSTCFKSLSAALILITVVTQDLFAFAPAAGAVFPASQAHGVSRPFQNPSYTEDTNIVALSLSAIQGNIITNPGTTLETAFSNIRPDLFSSLANLGVQKLGELGGLDPRVSSLIGVPVSGITGSLAGSGISAIDAINNGILRGVMSLGLEHVTQDLNPLLGSLITRAVSGAFEGFVGPSRNPIEGIIQGFGASAGNIAGLGNLGDDPWSRAQYLSRVISFSDAVRQNGLADAIEAYATGILHEDSISSILRSFQTVGSYVQDAFDNNRTELVQIDGIDYKKINLPNGDYLLFDQSGQNLVEIKKDGHVLQGLFGQRPDGESGLIYGQDSWSSQDFSDITLSSDYNNPDLTLSATNDQFRFTLTYKDAEDYLQNRPYLIMSEAINRETSYSGPRVTLIKSLADTSLEFTNGTLTNGSIQQDETYTEIRNGAITTSNTLIDQGVLSSRQWIQDAWNDWSNLVTTDPTLQSIGGYGIGITEAILTAPQAFEEFVSHPIASLLAIPAALRQAYQTISTGNPYESGQMIGNLTGGIVVGLATDSAVRTILPSGAGSSLQEAQRIRVLNNIADSQAARQASNFDLYTSAIRTPRGLALQERSVVALDAVSKAKNGATLYKIGVIGRSNIADAQYWSLENPFSPGFAERYGIPPENIANPNLVVTAKLKPGASVVARPAPGVGTNGGGMIEIVTEEGGVDLLSVSVGGQ